MYFNLVADFDTHQVLTDFQRSGIRFSSVRDHVGNIGWHDVRIDGEPWLHPRKDNACLLGSCVVLDYFLSLLNAVRGDGLAECLRINYLVNQNVGSLSELYQVF